MGWDVTVDGFTVDADALVALGDRVRSAALSSDAGLPPGVSGCGSTGVMAAWDGLLTRLTWTLHERLTPGIVQWGSAVRSAGVWFRERDGAVSGLFEGKGGKTRPLTKVMTPVFKAPASDVDLCGPLFRGSGGPGVLWSEDDPGVGDMDSVERSFWWMDAFGSVVAELAVLVRHSVIELRGVCRGEVGEALAADGDALAERSRLLVEVLGGSWGLSGYPGTVREIARKAMFTKGAVADATRQLTSAATSLSQTRSGAQVDDAALGRALRAEDSAEEDLRAARIKLGFLVQEREDADRLVTNAAYQLADEVAMAVPPAGSGFTAAGRSAQGAGIQNASLRASASGSLDEEREAIDAILDSTEDGFGPRLQDLLDGLGDGTLNIDDLRELLLGLPYRDRKQLEELMLRRKNSYPQEVALLSSLLLASACDAAEVGRLTAQYTFLEPTLTGEYSWRSRQLAQFDPDNIDFSGIGQGDLGDCWLLAGLGAVAAVDPEIIRSRIRVNTNGTYTVTVYRRGQPVEVTVSGYVPVDDNDSARYAGDWNGEFREPNWVSIYEKAAAQVVGSGSYGGLVAGRPGTGISTVTGESSTTVLLPGHFLRNSGLGLLRGSQTFERIEAALWNGQPVSALVLWRGLNQDAASWHVYYVVGIEGDKIVLRNPWGYTSQAGGQEELRLTEYEFDTTFAWFNIGDQR